MTDEQRQQRLRYHMYETNEGIREHAERIVDLEELCEDVIRLLNIFCNREDDDGCDCPMWPDKNSQCMLRDVEDRARELEVEADE